MEFVGRVDPVRRLCAWLAGEDLKKPVSLISLSGPGGIGKSSLLDRALSTTDLTARAYLRLRLAGTAQKNTLGQLICHDLLQSCTQLDPMGQDYFIECRKNLEAMRWIDDRVRAEIELEAGADGELRQTVHKLFKLGAGLQGMLPVLNRYIDPTKVKPEHIDAAVSLLERAKGYQLERRVLGGIFPDVLGSGRRNRLRNAPAAALADGLASDLAAILSRYLPGDRAKPMPTKVAACDRLLLIIDDYEALSDVIGGFLIDHLIPRLGTATFESVIVVLGRDRLSDTHPAWKQRFDGLFAGEIRLLSFSRAEAEEYVRSRGIDDPAITRRILDETAGYPYLLAGEVDAELDGGRTALSLKAFHDRTTRWMTPTQRGWLIPLCFLDEVNEESIPEVLPDADAKQVLEWFKSESSVRSPLATTWTVLPVIRSRMLASLRLDSPRRYRELEERAASVNASPRA